MDMGASQLWNLLTSICRIAATHFSRAKGSRMTLVAILLQMASTTGYGLIVFRLLKLDQDLHGPLQAALSFAVGFGVVGWLIFPLGFAGFLNTPALIILLLVGLPGLFFLKYSQRQKLRPANPISYILLALICLAASMDIIEALTPPADADSLAYHFRIPLSFIETGKIFFIERAFDGAVPLLIQMTYIPALAIGGELAMMMWVMISGWATCFLLYQLCRFYLNRNWSLAVALIYLTTPAVVYSGGTGHVESRIGLFVLLVAWAISQSLKKNDNRYTVIAGLGVGFYIGAKYLGLFFALAAGITLLTRKGWLKRGIITTLIALIVGFQWYYWNAAHTGDPVFPMLFQWLGHKNLEWWPHAHHLIFKDKYLSIEMGVPKNLFWMIYYPFKATLDSLPIFEARRVGLGPYGLIILPFVLGGLWQFRSKILSHPLFAYMAIAGLFYSLWFLWGPSQRIRHLLPIYPLFLICTAVVAERFCAQMSWRHPLFTGLVLTIFLQLGGHGFFTLKFARFLGGDESRERYLIRNVVNFAPVPWVNANLNKLDKLLVTERQLLYYLKVPFAFASGVAQGAIDLDPNQSDPVKFYAQLKSQDITYLMVQRQSKAPDSPYHRPYELLHKAGCYETVQSFNSKRFASRTLPSKSISSISIYDVVRLKEQSCLK
jgi:4-amino-4-deoxy-L-arabinose transferase-like glycosyltransferase